MSTSILPGERPDRLEEECAVFGVFAPGEDVARMTCFGLQALQHRGQESAGIAVGDGETIMVSKDLGLVTQVFDESRLAALEGYVAVGHARYSTSGAAASWEAAQPHISAIDEILIALAHNGTLVNTNSLRARLIDEGIQLRAGTDSEVAAKAIGSVTQKTHHLREGIRYAMQYMEGAYAMVLASPDTLYAFRDPNGIRPLCIGKLMHSYVVASESCALDALGATFIRDIEPGELIVIEDGELRSMKCDIKCDHTTCVFDYIYFARPDSVVDGASVAFARQEAGRYLAEEYPVDADVVVGVPDSGIPAAIGYSKASGIPYDVGLIKNKYIGRTFIQPGQDKRERSVRIKLNALRNNLEGKRVILVDDSIVRGTTCARLVKILKDAGAKEVHMRISSPPFLHPCFFGTDVPDREYLIAYGRTVEEIRELIGVDSLGYLSLEATNKIAVGATCGFCNGCFSGEYPIEVPDTVEKNIFESGIGENG